MPLLFYGHPSLALVCAVVDNVGTTDNGLLLGRADSYIIASKERLSCQNIDAELFDQQLERQTSSGDAAVYLANTAQLSYPTGLSSDLGHTHTGVIGKLYMRAVDARIMLVVAPVLRVRATG